MLQLVNDNSTYKKINYNPLKLLKKDTCNLLENWRVKDFLGKNITKKDISLNNTNLTRIYGFLTCDFGDGKDSLKIFAKVLDIS